MASRSSAKDKVFNVQPFLLQQQQQRDCNASMEPAGAAQTQISDLTIPNMHGSAATSPLSHSLHFKLTQQCGIPPTQEL